MPNYLRHDFRRLLNKSCGVSGMQSCSPSIGPGSRTHAARQDFSTKNLKRAAPGINIMSITVSPLLLYAAAPGRHAKTYHDAKSGRIVNAVFPAVVYSTHINKSSPRSVNAGVGRTMSSFFTRRRSCALVQRKHPPEPKQLKFFPRSFISSHRRS